MHLAASWHIPGRNLLVVGHLGFCPGDFGGIGDTSAHATCRLTAGCRAPVVAQVVAETVPITYTGSSIQSFDEAIIPGANIDKFKLLMVIMSSA